LHAPDRRLPYAHPARLILILSLAPTVGLGIGRFAYSLVLPDMRDALGWSYSAAGFMNTLNAAGYLAGALMASKLVQRYGLSAAVRWGVLASVASLALCALSGNFVVLSFARLLAGLGAAVGFVASGAQGAAPCSEARTSARADLPATASCLENASFAISRPALDRISALIAIANRRIAKHGTEH